MKKIKIAQIGVSHDHARDIFDSITALDDVFEVAGFAVCEGEEKFYESLPERDVFSDKKRMSVEELLNTPDLRAVTIECREQELTKYAKMAAERGLHIHMDKPGSSDHEEFCSLLELCKKKNLIFHIGYMYRYNPAVQKAMEMVSSGKLGKIYSVEAQMSCLLTAEKRNWLKDLKGGMMFYLGCHLVDLILQIQGEPQAVISLNASTGFDGIESIDSGMAVFQYENGTSFVRTNAAEAGGGVRRQLVILGENGSIEIRPMERWLRHGKGRKNIVSEFREIYKDEALKGGGMFCPEKTLTDPFNRYDTMMTSFAEMVGGVRTNRYTYEYEQKLHKILLQACKNKNETENIGRAEDAL